MKKLILSIILFLFTFYTEAQTLQFDWAITQGTSSDADYVDDVSPSADGNIVVCGAFSGTLDFDYGAGVDSHTSLGFQDVFVQKLDPQGTVIWTRSFGSTFGDYGRSIDTDNQGNVYTTGHFVGTVDFDPSSSVLNLTSPTQSIFIQKLDGDGNFLWAFNVEGNSQGSKLSIDKDGNILLSGFFNGTIDLDPGVGVVNFTAPVNPHGFLAKYDASGNLIWAKEFNAANYIYINGLESDDAGNIFIGGYFEGDVDMDPSGVTNFLSTSPSFTNSYVAKYSTDGNLIWAKNFLGNGNFAYNMTIDKSGNSVSTGEFYGTVDFDPGVANTSSVSAYSDLFLVKIDSDGNFVWVNVIKGSLAEVSGSAVDIDEVGNVYFAGIFSDTADFDSGIGSQNVACSELGGYNLFLSKVNSDGDFQFVYTHPGDGYNSSNAICINADASIYVVGSFSGTIDFDPSAGTFNATASGIPEDFFIQKYFCFVDTSITISGGTFTSNQTGATYQWMDCSTNLPLAGETNQSYTPAVNGIYCVIITNGECIGKSAEITINNVGLETNPETSTIIYPNPVSASLTVSSASTILTYEITDLSGKIVSHQIVNDFTFNIDMTLFSDGVYMLKTISENGLIQCSKIIKQ